VGLVEALGEVSLRGRVMYIAWALGVCGLTLCGCVFVVSPVTIQRTSGVVY
jgi:hypothetical protein